MRVQYEKRSRFNRAFDREHKKYIIENLSNKNLFISPNKNGKPIIVRGSRKFSVAVWVLRPHETLTNANIGYFIS